MSFMRAPEIRDRLGVTSDNQIGKFIDHLAQDIGRRPLSVKMRFSPVMRGIVLTEQGLQPRQSGSANELPMGSRVAQSTGVSTEVTFMLRLRSCASSRPAYTLEDSGSGSAAKTRDIRDQHFQRCADQGSNGFASI